MKEETMYLNPSRYVGKNGEEIQNYIEVTYDKDGRLYMDGHSLYFSGEDQLESDKWCGHEIIYPDGIVLFANEGWSKRDLKEIRDIWCEWDRNFDYLDDGKLDVREVPSEVLNTLWANSILLEREILQTCFPINLCENEGGYPNGTKNIIKIPNGVEIDGRDIGGCYIKPEKSYKTEGDEVYMVQAVDPMQKGRIALYHQDGKKEYVSMREFSSAIKNKELGMENSYKKEKEYEPGL